MRYGDDCEGLPPRSAGGDLLPPPLGHAVQLGQDRRARVGGARQDRRARVGLVQVEVNHFDRPLGGLFMLTSASQVSGPGWAKADSQRTQNGQLRVWAAFGGLGWGNRRLFVGQIAWKALVFVI